MPYATTNYNCLHLSPISLAHLSANQWQRIHLQMQETHETGVRSLGWEDPVK